MDSNTNFSHLALANKCHHAPILLTNLLPTFAFAFAHGKGSYKCLSLLSTLNTYRHHLSPSSSSCFDLLHVHTVTVSPCFAVVHEQCSYKCLSLFSTLNTYRHHHHHHHHHRASICSTSTLSPSACALRPSSVSSARASVCSTCTDSVAACALPSSNKSACASICSISPKVIPAFA